MDRRGFTLIEMMIVVAIIAILIAVAIPNMVGSRKAANEKSALGELRTIATALETYFIREDEYPNTNPLSTLANHDLLPSRYANVGSTIELRSQHYTINVVSISTDSYNIMATPKNERFGSKCYKALTGGDLWQTTYNGTCDAGGWERI